MTGSENVRSRVNNDGTGHSRKCQDKIEHGRTGQRRAWSDMKQNTYVLTSLSVTSMEHFIQFSGAYKMRMGKRAASFALGLWLGSRLSRAFIILQIIQSFL